MPLPTPVPGLVIRYSFLWSHEAKAGAEEGRKDRPCAVLLSLLSKSGRDVVTVLPVTHTPPDDLDLAVEIPRATKARLGLDGERSWIILDEANRFFWPTRVDHSTFNSWTDEQRQAYVRSLGREVRRLQSASKAYTESASSLRSNSANVDYNANRDLEGYFRDNSDLNRGFAGGGLSLLKKSRSEMTSLERMAYDKAMDDFIAREATRQAILFAQSKTHLETEYQALKADVK